MEAASAFRQALLDGSVADIRALWAVVFAHLPQPKDDQEAAVMMHNARTQALSIPLKDRAWSHRWLTERGLPSALPDHLRARAERMYPVITDAVGIAVKARNPRYSEDAKALQRALENTVSDCYANGDKDAVLVKKRIDEVRKGWRG